jgi:hypothetical protein
VTTSSSKAVGEDRVEDGHLAVLNSPGGNTLGLHLGDPLADLLGHDVAHLHRPEERQQVPADLPRVVASHARLQLMMRQPLLQDIRMEDLLAPAGIASLAGADGDLSLRKYSVIP